MRLKEIIAEWYYLKDSSNSVPFVKQDSNIRDFYHKIAGDEIPRLVSSYLGNKGAVAKIIRGCIQNFVNAHGIELTKENSESLTKRIISQIRNQKADGNGF